MRFWGAIIFFPVYLEYKLFYINESDSAPHGVYMARFNIQSEDGSGARMELLVPDFSLSCFIAGRCTGIG